MEKKHDIPQQSGQGGTGRTVNRDPQADDQANNASNRTDISGIDQQEGLMNNGETGGGGTLRQQSGSSNPNE